MPTADEKKLELYNLAARYLGVKKLTSLTDGSPAQLVFADLFPTTRDAFLCENIWSFANRRYQLVDISEPADTPDAWATATAYVLGDTVVQSSVNYACIIAHTSGTFATDLTNLKWQRMATDDEMFFDEDGMTVVYAEPTDLLKLTHVSTWPVSYARESMLINSVDVNVIRSDTADLAIKYIMQQTDLRRYFPLAFEALAFRLARDAAYNLVESLTKRKQLVEEYEKVFLPRAMAGDSHQSSPLEAIQNEWENSRAGSGLFGRNGAETWHPVS